MSSYNLDRKEYSKILLYDMKSNNTDAPFFIKKYKLSNISVKLHRHEYMQINYVFSGKAEHMINNKKIAISGGDIFIIPPYVPHAILAEALEVEICEFEFLPQFINDELAEADNLDEIYDFAYVQPFWVKESAVRSKVNLSEFTQIQVENLLNKAINEYIGKKTAYRFMIKSILLKLLVILGREYQAQYSTDLSKSNAYHNVKIVLNAVEYMCNNYDKEITLQSISKKFLVSPSYFSYLFKSIVSKSFLRYLVDLRIACAKELLLTTDKRIIDICYESGFKNIHHFNRTFRQLMCMSPSEYRNG